MGNAPTWSIQFGFDNNNNNNNVGSVGGGGEKWMETERTKQKQKKSRERNKKLDDVMVREQVERIDYFIFINLLKH